MRNIFNAGLFLFFLLCNISAPAQKIHVVGNQVNTFFYEKKLYKFQELEDVMIKNSDAYLVYRSALSTEKHADVFKYITLSSMLVGSVAAIVDPSPEYCDLFCISTGQAIGIVAWLIVVPTIGVTGLILRLASNRKKIKALSLYNDTADLSDLQSTPLWNLALGSTKNGVGLVLNF